MTAGVRRVRTPRVTRATDNPTRRCMMTSKLKWMALLTALLLVQPVIAGSCGGGRQQARTCRRARSAACEPKAAEAEGSCAERKACATAPEAAEPAPEADAK